MAATTIWSDQKVKGVIGSVGSDQEDSNNPITAIGDTRYGNDNVRKDYLEENH